MNSITKNYLPAGLMGALSGLVVFFLGVYDGEFVDSHSYFWGGVSYFIWGVIVSVLAVIIIKRINTSSAFQIKIIAMFFSFFVLMLFTTTQVWILQKSDSKLLKRLDRVNQSAELIEQQIKTNSDWNVALRLINDNQIALRNIQSNLNMARTMQLANISVLKLEYLKNKIEILKRIADEKKYGSWNERVFVRSSIPSFLEAQVQTEIPMIYKNPPNSRPYDNDLLAIIYDGYIRND